MTEKQYAPTKQEKKANKAVETPKQKIVNAPIKKEEKKTETKVEETKKTEEVKPEEKKEEAKEKKKQTVPKIKRVEAVVNSYSLPVSTKTAGAICKFIKGKKIEKAIEDLEQVIKGKKAVPMKGEIPHRKGKIMSGRFPKNASKHFITVLKALRGNSIVNGIDEPVINEAIANMASRPFGRFGRMKKKRTHITIKAKEKKLISKKNKMKNKTTKVKEKKK